MGPGTTQYARSGDTHIAYQVTGDGPIDIVFVPGWVSHVELCWAEPSFARLLNQLASFSRLILFDKRGTGLSDRVPNDKLPGLEERADDLMVVMDAVGSKKAVFAGYSEGGNLSAFFAASHPDRVHALVMFGTFAKRIYSPDYPWAPTVESRQQELEHIEREWGNRMDLSHYVPSAANDEAFVERLATYFRRSASPGAAVALLKMNTQVDIRNILPTIHVPTLIMHRTGDQDVNVEEGRWMAKQIPNAKFVEFPGDDHLPWVGDQDIIIETMREFLHARKSEPPAQRALATILFTDIVGSTERARNMGDQAWRSLLDAHDKICADTVAEFEGRLVKTTGDGALATFSGPGRGIESSQKVIQQCSALGLNIRAGLHTGECEIRDDEIAGVAVHLAARVSASAGSGELLVSRTVRDLVAGSNHTFEFRGEYSFKGFDEKWSIYSVV
ncbi:MAG: alpha/beta fold hydrolase [Rhizobiaceae bacterium]|nr:alpha/beta fold hydrolase [Rhizobiaceae bacterium]